MRRARLRFAILLLWVSPQGLAQTGQNLLLHVETAEHITRTPRAPSQMLAAYAQQLDLADGTPATMRPDPIVTVGLSIAGLTGLALAHIEGRHDKIDHITAGYLVGLSTSGIYTLYIGYPESRWSKAASFLAGVAASAAVGALKEEYDGRTGTGQVDDVDIYATIGGGVGGALTISLIDWLFI